MKSEKIHPDFGYKEFNVKKSSILAWRFPEKQYLFRENHKPIRQIFEYKTRNIPNGEFEVNSGNDYIFIVASEETIKKFRLAENNAFSKKILICSVYIPILTDLFHAVQIDKDENQKLKTPRKVQIIIAVCEKILNGQKRKKSIQMFKIT